MTGADGAAVSVCAAAAVLAGVGWPPAIEAVLALFARQSKLALTPVVITDVLTQTCKQSYMGRHYCLRPEFE